MIKLKCLIGSIGFMGKQKNVEQGDIFEVSEKQAETLIAHGYAKKRTPHRATKTTPETTHNEGGDSD